jgi:hypothetical protein
MLFRKINAFLREKAERYAHQQIILQTDVERIEPGEASGQSEQQIDIRNRNGKCILCSVGANQVF